MVSETTNLGGDWDNLGGGKQIPTNILRHFGRNEQIGNFSWWGNLGRNRILCSDGESQ